MLLSKNILQLIVNQIIKLLDIKTDKIMRKKIATVLLIIGFFTIVFALVKDNTNLLILGVLDILFAKMELDIK